MTQLTGIVAPNSAHVADGLTARDPAFDGNAIADAPLGHGRPHFDYLTGRFVPRTARVPHNHRRANLTMFPKVDVGSTVQ